MGDDSRLFIAVDPGAGSGRVFLTGCGSQERMLVEIRRFRYASRSVDGHLRWDAHPLLLVPGAWLADVRRDERNVLSART
jgi:hypothetical protein